MRSEATTVRQYLDELPAERRPTIEAVYDTVRAAMPPGYEESMAFGMIGWGVPLSTYPETYNKQPLSYTALAAQKNYNSLYLMAVYSGSEDEDDLRRRWEATGRTLDMGKCCLRFRSLDDLDLDIVADVVASTPVEELIRQYEQARTR